MLDVLTEQLEVCVLCQQVILHMSTHIQVLVEQLDWDDCDVEHSVCFLPLKFENRFMCQP